MIKKILSLFKRKEKIEPPDVYGVIRVNSVAQESGIYDDENKYIELNMYGTKKKIKFSNADVDSLREQGIPIV